MTGFNSNKDRKVVPRWRTFDKTLKLGELGSYSPPPSHKKVASDFLSSKVIDWQKYRTKVHAAELVGATIVLGRESECEEAARFLLQDDISSSLWVRELARRALRLQPTDQSSNPPEVHQELSEEFLSSQIRSLRQLVRIEPRDAILWVDLSRLYATLGLRDRAEQCMTIALQLAKNNRFILRSASCLWVSLDDPEKARDIVTRTAITRYDPWLLAVEVALSDLAERNPRFVKSARKILSNEDIDPRHISELASALATLELGAGSVKTSKRLFKKSLEKPTENSIAQAVWISKHCHLPLDLTNISFDRQKIFEANYWISYYKKDWEKAVKACKLWRDDQPFSEEPYIYGSYVLTTALEDYKQGEELAEEGCKTVEGLKIEKAEPALRNNLAFAQINNGNTDEAEKTLSKINSKNLSDRHGAILKATQGLLAFRTKDVETGRKLYLDARNEAQKLKDKHKQTPASVAHASASVAYASACVLHTIEEIRSNQEYESTLSEAKKALSQARKSSNDPMLEVLEQKLDKATPGDDKKNK